MRRGSFVYRDRYMQFDTVVSTDGYLLEENGYALGVCKRARKWWAYELGTGLSVAAGYDTRKECVCAAKKWAGTTQISEHWERYQALCEEFAGKERVFTGTVIS